ncbi:MAG: PASTA domain-containing protein, partial [Gemmatimonadota bacterium]
ARPGAPVYLTVSRGAERHLLPDVAGLTERQARIVLERLGYVTRVTRAQDPMQRDRAVRTRPPAGTELPVPSEVELVISAGPPVVSVPDLAGRHVDDVQGILEEIGLELGSVSYDPAAFEAPGRIVGQYPPAGYQLLEGGTVEVRVAGRPEDRGATPPDPASDGPI